MVADPPAHGHVYAARVVDLSSLLEDPIGHLAHRDQEVRRLAVSVCAAAADARWFDPLVTVLVTDTSPRVRAEAAEVLAAFGPAAETVLLARRAAEAEPIVVEAIVTALGELESRAAVEWLAGLARSADDRIVREAAVAALGAVGDPAALPVLLEAVTSAPPQVRRRAVVALTAFDEPEAEAAIAGARDDRNPMVREVAEMIVGRVVPEWQPVEPSDEGH